MVNKVILWVLVALSFSFAEFYFAYDAPEGSDTVSIEVFNCDSDSVSFAMRKRELAKQFKTCAGKRSNYTVSVLFFTVAEGETGVAEEAECFKAYSDSLFLFARCGEAALSGKPLFSLDERLAYQYYFGLFNNVLQYIRDYEKFNIAWEGKEGLDKYNMDDEKNALAAMTFEKMETAVADAQGSREDKDMLLLYYKYLRSKYDWQYRCSIKPAFTCDTSWLGEQKADFLKKYPETQYRGFIETQMPSFADPTEEEKKLAKADDEKIEQKNREHAIEQEKAERNVWVALSGMAMFGIPATSTNGFDDNFDVSNMLTFGLKASWRSVVFQYQYFMAFGDNNKGGSVSEKGYTLMGGLMLGPKKIFTLDVLFGLSYIDTYPLNKDMPEANLDDESWTLAFQGTYYFPISSSWDITAHIQARMNFIENYCRDSYWDPDGFSDGYGRCEDPYRNGDNDKYWDDMQWTFSAGIGIRFWKPRY